LHRDELDAALDRCSGFAVAVAMSTRRTATTVRPESLSSDGLAIIDARRRDRLRR